MCACKRKTEAAILYSNKVGNDSLSRFYNQYTDHRNRVIWRLFQIHPSSAVTTIATLSCLWFSLTCGRVSKLTTDHSSIRCTPRVITNSSPLVVVADLNPTFQWTATSNKSHISSSTVSICVVDNNSKISLSDSSVQICNDIVLISHCTKPTGYNNIIPAQS